MTRSDAARSVAARSDTELAGRNAFITGAGRGIGREAALLFAERGATVVAVDLDGAAAAETAGLVIAAGGQAIGVGADVSVRAEVAAAVQQGLDAFGALDCAFNNAGIGGPLAGLLDYTDDDFERVMRINVTGVWNCLREQIPVMLAAGGGSIVNASSGLGVVASPNMSAYVASKHAVFGLTRTAALEFSSRGVRVNAVLPGVIDTAMPSGLTVGRPEVYQAMIDSHPMGRLGDAREVAAAAAWLCSTASSFVTGHGLAVDGGHLIQ